eukprot:4116512-Pyramimonas_sp.AAC.1
MLPRILGGRRVSVWIPTRPRHDEVRAGQGSTRTRLAHKKFWGELNSSVVKWLPKGLMSASSPTPG